MNILIITNILTPYRMDFFDKLSSCFKDLNVNLNVATMVGEKSDRTWRYEDLKRDYTILLKNRTIKIKGIFIHFNKDIEAIIQKTNPDIVVCAGSYIQPTIWKIIALKKIYKYKIFFWSETHLSEQRNYPPLIIKIREIMRNFIYKKFDGFWYSGELSKQFIEKYSDRKKILLKVPNTIDNDKFYNGYLSNRGEKQRLRQLFSLEKYSFIFFTPARLSKVKGIDKFIDILSCCKNKDEIVVVVAGEGEEKERLLQLAKEKKVNLKLIGNKVEDEIIKLYAVADFFLLPSISDPNPLSVIEALWSGLPLLVSSHVGNYPEAVVEGENGFVFDYTERQKLINILESITTKDNSWLINAKNKSLNIAKEMYDSNKIIYNLALVMAEL